MYESIRKEDTLRNHVFSLQADLQVRLEVKRCADVHADLFADWFPTLMMISGAGIRVDFHADWNPDWKCIYVCKKVMETSGAHKERWWTDMSEHQLLHSASEHSETMIGCQ